MGRKRGRGGQKRELGESPLLNFAALLDLGKREIEIEDSRELKSGGANRVGG